MPDIIFGIHPILEALNSGKRSFNKIIVAKGVKENRILHILRLARERKIPVQYIIDRKHLDKLVKNSKHQGIIAYISPIEYKSPEEIIKLVRLKSNKGIICILDEVNDPHNLGAIIRSAEVLGIDGIVITKRHSCPITNTVQKTSAGATEYIPVARIDNLANFIEELKKENFWIVGADIAGEICYEVDLSSFGRIVLVIGSEGKGLRQLIKKKCDILLKIPMRGEISSLNASCAASVLMYEICRQMKFIDKSN